MSARPRAGSLSFDESGCLYETYVFYFVDTASRSAPRLLFLLSSRDIGMPWESMGRNSFLWEFTSKSSLQRLAGTKSCGKFFETRQNTPIDTNSTTRYSAPIGAGAVPIISHRRIKQTKNITDPKQIRPPKSTSFRGIHPNHPFDSTCRRPVTPPVPSIPISVPSLTPDRQCLQSFPPGCTPKLSWSGQPPVKRERGATPRLPPQL